MRNKNLLYYQNITKSKIASYDLGSSELINLGEWEGLIPKI